MEAIAFTIFSILFFAGWWQFVRFYKHLQETVDRRYPQYSGSGDTGVFAT